MIPSSLRSSSRHSTAAFASAAAASSPSVRRRRLRPPPRPSLVRRQPATTIPRFPADDAVGVVVAVATRNVALASSASEPPPDDGGGALDDDPDPPSSSTTSSSTMEALLSAATDRATRILLSSSNGSDFAAEEASAAGATTKDGGGDDESTDRGASFGGDGADATKAWVRDLLGAAVSRAEAIVVDGEGGDEVERRRRRSTTTTTEAAVRRLADAAAARAAKTLVDAADVRSADSSSGPSGPAAEGSPSGGGGEGGGGVPRDDDLPSYLSNPAVTPTALAHKLWSTVIRPNVDTVVDATCGNGRDAVALSSMLFPPNSARDGQDDAGWRQPPRPELLCVDVQRKACRNTMRSLLNVLDDEIFAECVRVLETSHDPLPRPRDDKSVGLVCYNLGYLPGSSVDTDDREAFVTQMETTIRSLTDAALLVRRGGMVSVMTYPGTNLNESNAVRFFMEGLVMLTSRQEGGWRRYLDNVGPDEEGHDGEGDGERSTFRVRELVTKAVTEVASEGDAGQTWRVFEHRSLGRLQSPILVTGTRIK